MKTLLSLLTCFALVWFHPKATVICIHSLTQSPACLNTLATALNLAGYKVVCLALRGHGEYKNEEISYDKSIQDLLFAIREQRTKGKVYLIGESVGAAVVIRAATLEHVDGIVLTSCGSTPQNFDWKLIAGDLILGLSNLNRPLDVRPYILQYSSDDPRITHDMVIDPAGRLYLTGIEMIKTKLFLGDTKKFVTKLPKNLPVFIIQGNRDRIVKNATKLYNLLQVKDKKLVVIDSGHIILGSKYIKPEVIMFIIQWLNGHAT